MLVIAEKAALIVYIDKFLTKIDIDECTNETDKYMHVSCFKFIHFDKVLKYDW